jgi:hypothetical protein
MKKAVFWDVAPCRSGVNRRFGGTYLLRLQGGGENKKIRTPSVRQRRTFIFTQLSTVPNVQLWSTHVVIEEAELSHVHGFLAGPSILF